MKLLLILMLIFAFVCTKQTKTEYKHKFTQDLIEFTNSVSIYLTNNQREKFIQTNKTILARMMITPNIHTMDVYVMMYLEYKRDVITQINYKKQQTKLFLETQRKLFINTFLKVFLKHIQLYV